MLFILCFCQVLVTKMWISYIFKKICLVNVCICCSVSDMCIFFKSVTALCSILQFIFGSNIGLVLSILFLRAFSVSIWHDEKTKSGFLFAYFYKFSYIDTISYVSENGDDGRWCENLSMRLYWVYFQSVCIENYQLNW